MMRAVDRLLSWLVSALVAMFSVLGLTGCSLAMPFRGPAYSSSKGITLEGLGDKVYVGVTDAQLDGATRSVFDDHARETIESLSTNRGFIGYSVRSRVFGNEVWTLTVWSDEAALDAFVSSKAHRSAVKNGLSPVLRAKFLRFTMPAANVPPQWDDVLARLENVAFTRYR